MKGLGSHQGTSLFEEPAFLNDVRDSLLSDATGFFFFFFFCFLEIYVQQVVYVLRRTGSDKLPLGVIMLIESSRS